MARCGPLLLCGSVVIGVTGLLHPGTRGYSRRGSAEALGPEILITSTGGAGTTRFIDEMLKVRPQLRLNHKDDLDHMKHAPLQKLLADPRTAGKMRDVKRIIYLHAEPVRGILSLAHRHYLNMQAKKVRTDSVPKRLGPKAPSLEQLLAWEGDFLQLEAHLRSFLEQCRFPVAFVDVTRKTRELKRLAAFLGVSKPELARRLSPWGAGDARYSTFDRAEGSTEYSMAARYNVSLNIVRGLQKKYANLSTRLSKLGALFILQNTQETGCVARTGTSKKSLL